MTQADASGGQEPLEQLDHLEPIKAAFGGVDYMLGEINISAIVRSLVEEIERLRSLPSPPSSSELTFDQFSVVNRQRCESPSGFNHALASWSTSDWFLAVLGELGEAANIAKKLNRVRDGITGNKETADELRNKLRRELGDAFVYLDLLAQSLGISIGASAVEVFNGKSDELGCSIRIELPSPPSAGVPPHPSEQPSKVGFVSYQPSTQTFRIGGHRVDEDFARRVMSDIEELLAGVPPSQPEKAKDPS